MTGVGWTTLIGGILLAASVVLVVLEPILSGRRAAGYRAGEEHDEGAARRRVALTALRDLEYDRATRKLDLKDYETLKGELSREALRHLDAREGAEAPPVEEGLATRELEEEIAQIRRAIREGFECRSCGRINEVGARYCGGCGRALGPGDQETP